MRSVAIHSGSNDPRVRLDYLCGKATVSNTLPYDLAENKSLASRKMQYNKGVSVVSGRARANGILPKNKGCTLKGGKI